jgi:glutaminyl-tRNA synthetase
MTANVTPSSLNVAQANQKFQLQQYGYFLAIRLDHVTWSNPVFN